MKCVRKVAIIGAGASGLMCAIHAVSSTTRVVLFDKNSFSGKKILVTGNGRCNYWNSNQDLKFYHSSDSYLLSDIITPRIQKEVLAFFESIGVVPNIRDGYYYPYSNQASSIRDLLENKAKELGVIFAFQTEVLDTFKENNQFVVCTNDGREYFDDLVIATGSKASPKTGSTGDGYTFAEKFGHTIVSVRPSLVQLVTDGKFLKDWAGVRSQATVSLYEDGKFLNQETGEVQLTDYGVSGICIFNLSHYISFDKKYTLKICFLPFLDKSSVISFFHKRNEDLGDVSLTYFLEGILPFKLLQVILKRVGVSNHATFASLSSSKQEELISMIMEFPVTVLGTKGFDSCQVCSGGVCLSEVSLTLESKLVPHLYFIGEVLDVDGNCGGYNLGFAFMSGIIVGKVLRGDKNDSNSSNKD